MPSPAKPKVVEAQEFIVRGENGKTRAILGVLNAWRQPVLSLHDERGVPRLYIDFLNGFPAIRVMPMEGSHVNPLFSFGRTENGSPILAVSRCDATPAFVVIAEDGKDVRIGLCRRDGEPVWVDLDMITGKKKGTREKGMSPISGKRKERKTKQKGKSLGRKRRHR